MTDFNFDKMKLEPQIIDNFYAPLRHTVTAYTEVDDDYSGFVDEIIDDLETFYDVSKYPAVLTALHLLKDYRDNPCHVLSKDTLKNLRTWRSKK